MTIQEILQAIQSLAESERVAQIEELSRSVQADSVVSMKQPSSLSRVCGMLKVKDALPAEHELMNGIVDDLLAKHA